MTAARAVALHLVDGLAHVGQARANLAESRRAIAELVGAGIEQVWHDLQSLDGRLEVLQVAIRSASTSSSIALDPSHTGIGCAACGGPEPHGARRSS